MRCSGGRPSSIEPNSGPAVVLSLRALTGSVGMTDDERERYRELFLTSARYEYRFWDAAWRQEEWEVATEP